MDVVEAFLRAHSYIYESKPINAAIYNMKAIQTFLKLATRVLFKWLNRRSQHNSFNWETFALYIRAHPLPKARICHALF